MMLRLATFFALLASAAAFGQFGGKSDHGGKSDPGGKSDHDDHDDHDDHGTLMGRGVVYTPNEAADTTSITMCVNSCNFASDSACDDGGSGSQWYSCSYGTDCLDCNPRGGFSMSKHTHDDAAPHRHKYVDWVIKKDGREDDKEYWTDHNTGRRLSEAHKSKDQSTDVLMDAVKTLKAEMEEMKKAELATQAEIAALKDEIEEMKKDGLATLKAA